MSSNDWLKKAKKTSKRLNRIKSKENDMRGRHTKKSREDKRKQLQEYYKKIKETDTCKECGSFDFRPSSDNDSYVCIKCGMLSNIQVFDYESPIDTPKSISYYLHRNYFAERMRQWSNTEPRFTKDAKNKISSIFTILQEQNPDYWAYNELSFSKARFGEICRILNKLYPEDRWNTKLERWLQARSIIYTKKFNPDYHPDFTLIELLKTLFDPVAYCFTNYFKDLNEFKRHNIPKLDLIILFFLYTINEELVIRYGWYFLSEQLYWQSNSIKKDFKRIKVLFDYVNNDFKYNSKTNIIRRASYSWFRHNKLKTCDLEHLVWLITRSEPGRAIFTTLVSPSLKYELQ